MSDKKEYALFGNPVAHSLSPKLHNSAFTALNYNAHYSLIELKDGSKLRETFISKNLAGANVTVPYKEVVYSMCDSVSGVASEIGAVNTIIKNEDKLVGYNSDALGFYNSLPKEKYKTALVIGAGGTAKTIVTILLKNEISVTVVNRSRDKLKYFKNLGIECFTADNFNSNTGYELIINATSAGLSDSALPLSKDKLKLASREAKLMYDVVYNKKTPFLSLAKELGLRYQDGSDMLLRQAVYANMLFTGYDDSKKLYEIMKLAIV